MHPTLTALLMTVGVLVATGIMYLFALFVTFVQSVYGLPAALILFVVVLGGGMWAYFTWLISRTTR